MFPVKQLKPEEENKNTGNIDFRTLLPNLWETSETKLFWQVHLYDILRKMHTKNSATPTRDRVHTFHLYLSYLNR